MAGFVLQKVPFRPLEVLKGVEDRLWKYFLGLKIIFGIHHITMVEKSLIGFKEAVSWLYLVARCSILTYGSTERG